MSNSHIFIPTDSADDWRRFLAEPERQWVPGYSAHALATVWEECDSFPPRVRAALEASGLGELEGLELVLAIPEHKTQLPGGRRSSQTDLLVVARNDEALVVMAVEGKVEEPFGPAVEQWRTGTPGKERRLAFLCEQLGLEVTAVGRLRYQLLHRTVSALLEAQRIHAQSAMMLVHSFSATKSWFDDYAAFARALGVDAAPDVITRVGARGGRELFIGWVSDEAPA